MSEPLLCLCGCGRLAGLTPVRGLSHACYVAALKAIKQGKTSWAKREKAGTALPAQAKTWNTRQFLRQRGQ
jgi:hypothetical protein